MILGITEKIFNAGLKKFSIQENTELKNIQIQISMDNSGNLKYNKCVDYEIKNEVTFLQVMDKKIDLLGYKGIATPVIQESILHFVKELQCEINDVSIFMTNQNGTVYVMIYKKGLFIRHLSLKQHLNNINLE